jgi:TonB family protein
MNTKHFFFAATLSGGLLCGPALSSAAVVSDIAIESAQRTYIAPMPVKVVAPIGVARRFEGETIRVRFSLDETGSPLKVELVRPQDTNLVHNLLPAVAQWRFKPAMQDGRAVSSEVELPIRLVADPAT